MPWRWFFIPITKGRRFSGETFPRLAGKYYLCGMKQVTVDELRNEIVRQLGHEPSEGQSHAITIFQEFLRDGNERSAMILRGSAGTGKTSLAGAMARATRNLRQKIMLLAPTGRAAKVFSLNSGFPAFTIHRRIYREKSYAGIDGQFALNDNLYRDTLFMVDEASMIARGTEGGSMFGSGHLLDDLISYVYQGEGNRLMLIGDKAQLPPVGEQEAPALQGALLSSYGLKTFECDLDEVLRQDKQSGILYNATQIRRLITHDEATQLPRIKLRGFPDIVNVPGNELIESLSDSYSSVGNDETIVITRGNKRANIYNQGIRQSVLDHEDALCAGDQVMIVKNNYHWTCEDRTAPPFIANGDRAVVCRARRVEELYGFHFCEATLRFPDYEDYELTATLLLDTLTSEAPALTHEQSEKLYLQVMEDYADIPQKAERLKRLRQDGYFNALQVKYAYAVTCHKAQGGQWAHVYLDQGYMTEEMLTPDYIHWLYTAFTRATERLYLVNWPSTQIEEET